MFRKLSSLGFAVILAGASVAIAVPPAAAAPHGHFYGHRGHAAYGRSVGHRYYGRYRSYGRYRYGRRYYYGGPGYYGGYYGPYGYGYEPGAAVAAGIIGLAAGAIAAGAVHGGGGVAYCERRFRSYNPRTGLYRGYDGRYHRCS